MVIGLLAIEALHWFECSVSPILVLMSFIRVVSVIPNAIH
jgi:hypothetical protein